MGRVNLTRELEDPAIEETRRHILLTASPAQIRAYVEANVTNLSTAKEVIKELAVVISALAKRVDRG